MSEDLAERIKDLRDLLAKVRHASLSTVNLDGTPHNTPLLFLHDPKFIKVFWGSNPESEHSKNILRDGEVFIVVYDSFKGIWTGLYIKAINGHLLEGGELDEALEIYNQFRSTEGKKMLEKSYYSGDSHQKMWSAQITNLWINSEERDLQGLMVRDYRIEIKPEDLIEN